MIHDSRAAPVPRTSRISSSSRAHFSDCAHTAAEHHELWTNTKFNLVNWKVLSFATFDCYAEVAFCRKSLLCSRHVCDWMNARTETVTGHLRLEHLADCVLTAEGRLLPVDRPRQLEWHQIHDKRFWAKRHCRWCWLHHINDNATDVKLIAGGASSTERYLSSAQRQSRFQSLAPYRLRVDKLVPIDVGLRLRNANVNRILAFSFHDGHIFGTFYRGPVRQLLQLLPLLVRMMPWSGC